MSASSTKNILLVEDNEIQSRTLKNFIERNSDFVVEVEDRGDTAVSRIIEEQPDLVILDIGLPGLSGLEVCKRVRDRYSGLILVLTGRIRKNDQHVCFEAGADDYVNKPIEHKNILARVKALFLREDQKGGNKEGRAGEGQEPDRIEVRDLCIDRRTRSVIKGGEPVELTTSEFDLLWILASRAGAVLTRNELIKLVRGRKLHRKDRAIDVIIVKLRRKLGDCGRKPEMIKNVRGVGYWIPA